MTTRLLITGSAGFIGRHLMRIAKEKFGYEVFGLDLKYPVSDRGPRYRADIRRAVAMARVFDDCRPDYVVHAAALCSVRESMDIPREYVSTNLHGLLNVVDQCTMYKCPLVFISSGGTVYGEPQSCPMPLSHPLAPLDVYGTTKLAGEFIAASLMRQAGLDSWALRFPNVYGPGQDPYGEAGVVAIFARQMLDSKTPTIFGDGFQARDFMFVEDIAINTLSVIGCQPGAYNVGSGQPTDILSIYELMADIIGFGEPPKHSPAKKGEVRGHIALDPTPPMKATTTIRRGLEKTVEWFRGNRS